MRVKEALTKAKEILVERGVNRDGYFVNEKTGCEVCALGAVHLALGGEVRLVEPDDERAPYFVIDTANVRGSTEVRRALEQVIPVESEDGIRWVPQFNDTSETDQEVFDLFDRAIAAAIDED